MDNVGNLFSGDFAGRYRVGREIGRGGMALVFEALDLASQQQVAVKVLRGEVAAALGPRRFLREINIARALDHPNILPILDSGLILGPNGQVPFFVMPYVPGPTLRERLRRDIQLPISEVVRIGAGVARGLAMAHEKGVIHRDIKPENVLLDGDRVLVADFGVARIADGDPTSTSSAGLVIGTPAYMSPEQTVADPKIDARSDLYSLGVLLYEMAAGTPPFFAATAHGVIASHQLEPAPSLATVRPDAPVALVELVASALAKAPAGRPASAKVMIERLEASNSTTAARGPRLKPTIRRRVIGASLLAAAAVASLLLIRTKATPPPNDHRYLIGSFTVNGTDSVLGAQAVREALSGWQGVETVDGDRNGTLVDQAKTARNGAAGYLVMGQVHDEGDSTSFSAQLYRVDRDVVLLRQSTLRAARGPDHRVLARLIEAVLVPSLARDSMGAPLGSRSIPSLEAFGRGRSAVARWALGDAESAFVEATRADPAFARAQMWLALVRSWRGDAVAGWLLAAQRAADSHQDLSAVDQRKAAALVAFAQDNWSAACPLWESVTRSAPNDFAGWYSWASCLSTDPTVLRDRKSPSGWRFRASYQQSVQAYLRSFRLLPAVSASLSGSAFQPLRQMLMTAETDTRPGVAAAPDSGRFAGYPVLAGDTIAIIPFPEQQLARGGPTINPSRHRAAVQSQRRLFRDVAAAWASAEPTSSDAALALAIGLEMTEAPGALAAVDRARHAARNNAEALRAAATGVWMGLRASLPDDPSGVRRARLLADSLLARFGGDPSSDLPTLLSLAALTGQADFAATLARRGTAAEMMALPPSLAREGLPLLIYAAVGGPADSVRVLSDRVSRAIAATTAQRGGDGLSLRMELLGRPASLVFPEQLLPALKDLAGHGDYILDAQNKLAAGDSAGAAAIVRHVVTSRAIPPSEIPLDAAYSEARLLEAAGAGEEALSWLGPVISSLHLAPAHVFSDPARAGTLVRVLRLAGRLAERSGDRETALRLESIANIMWEGADVALRRPRLPSGSK